MRLERKRNVLAGSEEEDHTVVANTLVISFRLFRGTAERDNIHQCMRKPHFTPIHDAIPYTFYQRKHIVILWI
jgi:hypothetical protein